MKKTYTLKSGLWSEEIIGTLEEVMEIADNKISCNEDDIKIVDEHGEELAIRNWVGTLDAIECFEDAIQFGHYGYYTDWYIKD
jgi:hypothetical protein